MSKRIANALTAVALLTGVLTETAGSAQLSDNAGQSGRAPVSTAGEVGQRQTRKDTLGINPTARISVRVENRLLTRVQNRVDRYYNADASLASAIARTNENARTAGRKR